jgi:hypothetical protein
MDLVREQKRKERIGIIFSLSYQKKYMSLGKKAIYDIEGCIANIVESFNIIDNSYKLLMLAVPLWRFYLILAIRH